MVFPPHLTESYPLSNQQTNSYRRDGHILLRRVATPDELALFRPGILGVVDDVASKADKQGKINDYGKMFTQVTNVWRMNETVRQFVFARRFAKVAAELMGVDSVRLYHDQALIKEPGGKATPWHQDYYYWPLETEHTITMWMALVDIPREMGSMSFVSGSQNDASYQILPISDTSQAYFERIIVEKGEQTVSYELKAGDATFHSGRILHSAHANNSSKRREVMTVIYYADGTRILQPDNDHRRVDMEVFHPGQSPGELAASPLNPLLYP
jgi:ectoine hydroxylase-related dioxygenase (phytanoyl-CoA dioxygenase family)